MKKTIAPLVRWIGFAAIAAAVLPQSLTAAPSFEVLDAYVPQIQQYNTGSIIQFYLTVGIGSDDDAINENTIAEDTDFLFKFKFSDDTVRKAIWAGGMLGPDPGLYTMSFKYEVQENDYSIGVFSVTDTQFDGKLTKIKNERGESLSFLLNNVKLTTVAGGTMTPLEEQDDNTNIKVNPDNATIFKVNFLNAYGETILPTTSADLLEGQEAVQFVVNIGAKPPADAPVVVNIDWSVSNVFGKVEGGTGESGAQTTTLTMTEAQQVFIIDRILDDGAIPERIGSHTYTVTASTQGRADATMKATVKNVNPEITGFFGSVGLSTNTALAVDQEITVTAQIEDVAGDLDSPLEVTWRFGSRAPTSVNTEWMGSYWESVAVGTIPEGYSTISFSAFDKDRGNIATNALVYAEAGPLLMATVANTITEGLNNLGDGTIEIIQPGSGTIAWDPEYGNHLPSTATRAVIRANAFDSSTSADQYDSFYYKWFNKEDEGLEPNDSTRGLLAGYDPIARDATVNLLADATAPFADRAPADRVVQYYFSRELYRPDNFGDIDGDRLGDEWEIRWFAQSARNFTDPVTGEFVKPAESGAPVRADQATLLYDFSGSGNMDGDGLPANCFANIDYSPEVDTESIPLGDYTVQAFAYPLPANSVSRFGYMPLGGTHMVTYEEEQDIISFRANPYVDQNALNNVLIDFNNELEFRGVGLYTGFVDEAGDTIDFRPRGDGDDPNTDPMSRDTDGDGLPDGWEYYFWAVAYYNVGSDQWLSFNGAAPAGGSYQGTGDPISREDIMATFNPTSAAFVDEDIDHDGLTNLEEFALGTSPISWDTDGDGLPDGWEVEFGLVGGSGTTTSVDPETGATTTTVDNTQTIILNPLKANDGNYNGDGDWFAISDNLRHYDVFLAYDFDPRTGWCNPNVQTVTYAGNTFRTSYPNTAAFTAREEFNLGAWYVEHGYVGAIQGLDANADNYWGNWTSDPREPDTDGNDIPDGWEAYVGLFPAREPQVNGTTEGNADLEVDDLHPNGDGLNNLHEFLCVMAAQQYQYIADKYQDEIDQWSNKPWPTNPNPSVGEGYAHGGDTDNDQVLDGFEKDPNCNPTCCDTDHDYLPDLWECYYGTDPLVRDTFMDYDGDGLQNWQEYLTGAVWAWQYDKWYNEFRGSAGPGYGEVDMFDFFVDPEDVGDYSTPSSNLYGGFGRGAHEWDCAYGAQARQAGSAGSGAPFYFLSAEARNGNANPKLFGDTTAFTGYGFTRSGYAEDRTQGAVTFATADPWATDSDNDGMDDFYEAFHGLNPLYGGSMLNGDYDLVAMIDPDTSSPYPSSPWDLTVYPWLSGDPSADPDKDGLSSREESANFYVSGGTHHTDPSPYWLTDGTYERSFVNLYYQPGAMFATSQPKYWYFGIDGGGASPSYAFSFETNEGYDTDNDNVGDRSELTTDELASKADPLDFDNPRRRKVLYFNGVDAAARTRGAYSTDDENELHTFTVEAWICPVNPAAGRIQTIIERASYVPQDTAKGDVAGKRINFRLSITETGALRGEFHNYQGAHVTMETEAVNTGLRAGVWSHVAMTYSGTPAQTGYLIIYVDGVSKKASASNLQAFNGYLQDYTVSYTSGNNQTTEQTSYRVFSCPIVLGASDDNPAGTVNGYQTFAAGSISPPGTEPELTDYFEGWMDEVRIWDGARSAESIRATKSQRFGREDVAAWASATDKISGTPVSLRHHYTFDNLPDVVPAANRDPEAYLNPSDVESLPTGFAEVFTAPNDGSYPGIPWWNSSAYVNYRYDTRHIPWIEDSVVHTGDGSIVDSPRIMAVTDDAGNVIGYREYVYDAQFAGVTRTVDRYDGTLVAATLFPNGRNPYGNGYIAPVYTENLTWSVGSADTTTTTVDPFSGSTNTTSVAGSSTTVVYGGYDQNEGSSEEGDSVWWSADLLPLGGAVADIDVALWDGAGVGYELVTVDSDGDGIPDYWENLYGLDSTDPSDAWLDLDGDGLDNLAEYFAGTSPIAADTDGDGYPDYNDRDTNQSLTYGEQFDDKDGMPSWWEVQYGLNPRVHDADTDLDGDGWSNYAEYLAGTDPANASRFPEPPLLANIHYDGQKTDGTIVVYAYTAGGMKSKPDAVYTQEVHSKDTGALAVENEYLCTLHEGVTHYEGQLALGNIVNDGTFTIQAYSVEDRQEQNLVFSDPDMATPGIFYCSDCGQTYTPAQIVESGDGANPYICPHGHDNVFAGTGYASRLTTPLGDVGHIDYLTGKWSIDIVNYPDWYAGFTLTANYSARQGSAFSFPMRRKWTSSVDNTSDLIAAGHLREGNNRFFAFLDLDGDLLFDEGEPAGMALYQTVKVGAGPVEIDIPLTDFLTGFPRFAWEPVEGVDGYSVSIVTADGSQIRIDYTLPAERTFFMEQDVLGLGGGNLGSGSGAIFDWQVMPLYGDFDVGVAENPSIIASGSITNSVSSPARKAITIQYPSEGATVSDASIPVRWTMDYRNQGVEVTLRNTDIGTNFINHVKCLLPRRVGPLAGSYAYLYEIQKIEGNGSFIDLPDGHYTLLLQENIRSTAVSPASATVHFVVDHSGNTSGSALGSITGTVSYYGKIPFSIENETLATFDGFTTSASAALSRSPVPGTVTVKVVSGNTVLFTASDNGAREGMPNQGLYSTSDEVLSGSYVAYGDDPAVAIELATAPAAGTRLVASYKQSKCPIRVQAFRCVDGPTFSGAPAAQVTLYNKGAFSMEGLPMGSYCLRAFIDQSLDNGLNAWESVGYAMAVVRQTVGMENFATFDVPPGADNVEIVIADKDTDSDRLPDAWEYYYYQKLSTQGGDTLNKVGVYLWQEYADGELDSNPLVEDTDGDGLPDVVEHLIGSNNHVWDSDGDGIGDLEEFLAGSDPVDASSAERFKTPAPTFDADGTPALELETPALIPGLYIQYTILGKTAIDDPWTEVGTSALLGVYKTEPVGVPRGTVTIAAPAGADAAFYKVKVSFESDTILDR